MRIGSTPTHTFALPFVLEDYAKIQIVYECRGRDVLVLDTDRVTVDNKSLSVTLTEKESFLFIGTDVNIQVRISFEDGSVVASNIIKTTVQRCLDDNILSEVEA